MNSSTTYLSTFTTQLEAFNSELCKLFPYDNNLKTCLNMILLIKKTNPRKLIEAFESFALPYREKIISKDSSFLLTHNFNDLSEKGGNMSYADSLIKQLKEHWSEMNEEHREIAWKYFFIFFKLYDLCNKSK